MTAHAPLISGPFLGVGSVAGSLLAFVKGGWIALGALRGTPARMAPWCLAAGDFRRRPNLRVQGSLPLGSNFWPMSLYRPCT